MIGAVVAAYLVGSIPFALIVARMWGTGDPRAIGSGNPGASNVMRTSGTAAGALVAALDIAKGALGVALAERLSGNPAAPAAAGVAAIAGHVYPIWLRLQGGKGVATACGVFAMLMPAALPPALGLFIVAVWVTKYVSLGSLIAALALPAIGYAAGSPAPSVAAACAAAAIIVVRHRANVARLLAGTERRLGVRVG